MAAKKKSKKKKSATPKRAIRKKTTAKKSAKRSIRTAKKAAPKKKSAKTKVRTATRAKAGARKAVRRKPARTSQNVVRQEFQEIDATEYSVGRTRVRSGALSGDLQGLSGIESANSESVDELLEEGNAFEADVIAGVEHADRANERGVHTRQVPVDDVPEEYLDQD